MDQVAAIGIAERSTRSDSRGQHTRGQVEAARATGAIRHDQHGDDTENSIGYAVQALDSNQGCGLRGECIEDRA